MKACASCGRLYPLDAGYCPVDGTELVSATQVPVQAADGDARVGELLFERYQVRRVVADGAMGRVYEALDMQQRRNVAVKVLHTAVARDPVQVERFKREFEVSGQLPHDHIVDVLDFRAMGDGSYALIMEFLYGEELSGTLAREKWLPAARLVRMVSQVAIGLDKAHALQFVHRDIKPENVFLCQTHDGDIVKLLDFGSVKDKAENAKKLTMLGTTIGSPYYMSPEQAQGLETLDHRADVWAVGAIIFEALTGQVPFQGKNGPSILLQILTKEPPRLRDVATERSERLPLGLDTVLERAFKKLPALRYRSVGELANALGRAYALDGDHLSWADMPERDLRTKIAERLAREPSVPPSAKPASALDDFFGEGDALGDGLSAPVHDVPEPRGDSQPTGPRSLRPTAISSMPPRLPLSGGFSWWLWGALLLILVTVGALAWWL